MNPLSEPPFVPCWQGWAPIRYWISPEMRQFDAEIRIALVTFTREWVNGRPLRLRFEEIGIPWQPRCIDFRMAPVAVGFLGMGMYPPPLNVEPFAGDVTLNSGAFTRPEFRPLLLPTLIHEIAAHSLGLGHLYLRRSVRCPYIEEGRINLAPEDRAALVTMYGM